MREKRKREEVRKVERGEIKSNVRGREGKGGVRKGKRGRQGIRRRGGEIGMYDRQGGGGEIDVER